MIQSFEHFMSLVGTFIIACLWTALGCGLLTGALYIWDESTKHYRAEYREWRKALRVTAVAYLASVHIDPEHSNTIKKRNELDIVKLTEPDPPFIYFWRKKVDIIKRVEAE